MAWNESGGGDKDPWGTRGNKNDGPPDLDEAIRKLQGQLSGMFGGGGGGDKGDSGSKLSRSSISLFLVLALGLYAALPVCTKSMSKSALSSFDLVRRCPRK